VGVVAGGAVLAAEVHEEVGDAREEGLARVVAGIVRGRGAGGALVHLRGLGPRLGLLDILPGLVGVLLLGLPQGGLVCLAVHVLRQRDGRVARRVAKLAPEDLLLGRRDRCDLRPLVGPARKRILAMGLL